MSSNKSDLLDHLYEHNIDLRARRVYLQDAMFSIGEEKGDWSCEYATRGLLFLDKTPGKIELWVNTPGGCVAQMLALYDVIRS